MTKFPFYNSAKILLYIRELEKKTPIFVDLHPSNVCNHRCIWCRYGRSKEMLSSESMISLLERYPTIKGISIGGGGEPLTNDHVLDFIKKCSHRDIKTGMFTNGGLLSKNNIEIIGNNCQYCRISLDAATSETHAKVHRVNGFHKILDNIKELRQTKLPELGISYLVSPENVKEIVMLSELNLPIDYIHFKPLIEGIDEQIKKEALKNIRELQTRVNFALKYDRIEKDLMCNHNIKCRVADLITLLASNDKEYVCCEHDGIEEFVREKWNGSTKKCHTCRYNNYNEILDMYYRNTFSKEFL